jgi:hypothetical protein
LPYFVNHFENFGWKLCLYIYTSWIPSVPALRCKYALFNPLFGTLSVIWTGVEFQFRNSVMSSAIFQRANKRFSTSHLNRMWYLFKRSYFQAATIYYEWIKVVRLKIVGSFACWFILVTLVGKYL